MRVFARLRTYLSFVRVSHSVFALPFALVGALLASRYEALTWQRVLWIVVAMVSARSAAMAFNRIVDARFDALNPRTAMREIPRGALSSIEASLFLAVTTGIFVYAAWRLGPLCLALSPLALAIVFWYSLAKRYTWATQFFLGLALAVAPVGGWIAAAGPVAWEPVLLALAIGTWVAGFDILYACQDLQFDRVHGLHSIPVRYGIRTSLHVSRSLHVVAVLFLAWLGVVSHLGAIYFAGVIAVGALLTYEQSLVSIDDLSQVKRAFDLNGYVGILYLLTTVVALYVH
ncbi:MAG: 4-hydroxybenzoate octaprenyltransferase [Luteitalea sp.]|nr:4-hydroxybenzoate octaprenyltransferase [Luteitalea sp.]